MTLYVRCAAAALVGLSVACGGGEFTPGDREPCAYPGGELVGCEPARIEAPAEACFRLVACGVIALEDDSGFDWTDCVAHVDALSAERFAFLAACMSASACDDLQPDDDGIPCFSLGVQR